MFLHIEMKQSGRYFNFVPFQYRILICLIKMRASLKEADLPVELFHSSVVSFPNPILPAATCLVSSPPTPADTPLVCILVNIVSSCLQALFSIITIFSKAPKLEFLL